MSLPKPGSSDRTQLNRMRERAVEDRTALYEVLDSNILCHIALSIDGEPVILPYGYTRDGDRLLIHGSSGARFMRLIAEGAPLCISVTELNAIVVARSTFNSSMNYRSVVIFGRASEVTGEDKARALEVVSDGFLPGRSAEVRKSTKKELAATVVLSVPLDEASLKVREHGVEDEPEDLGTGVWAGLIPLSLVAGEPIADDDESRQLPVPQSVRAFIANPKA